jgi:putative aminopeptidase FrvX
MMMRQEEVIELLEGLSSCPGPPGGEERVASIIRKHLAGFCGIRYDGLGSLLAEKPGKHEKLRLLVCAHMDEIGFMVQSITDRGLLRLQPLGSWGGDKFSSLRLVIHTRKGDFPAVLAAIPPHFKKNAEEKDQEPEIIADIGALSREEACERGIMLGDLLTPASRFEFFGDQVLGNKAWDDRVGCAALILAMKHLQTFDHAATVIAAGTVQEEVGTRGATTAVTLADPDLAIVLEGAPADDFPGLAKDEPQGALGRGCQIRLYDPTTITNRNFWQWAAELASQHNIAHQLAVRQSGSTDARAIHVACGGIPTLILSTPVRYIHSSTGLLHTADFASTVSLLKVILESLNQEVSDRIRHFGAKDLSAQHNPEVQ